MNEEVLICLNCGDPCEIIEDGFDYGGTHCNYGRGGFESLGYFSKCCLDQFLPELEYLETNEQE